MTTPERQAIASSIELDQIVADMVLGQCPDDLVDWLGMLWLAQFAGTFPHLHFIDFVTAWRDENRYRSAQPTNHDGYTGRRKGVCPRHRR